MMSPFLPPLLARHVLLMAISVLFPLGLTTPVLQFRDCIPLRHNPVPSHTGFPKLLLSVSGSWASFVNPTLLDALF